MDKEKLVDKLSQGAKKRHMIIGSLIFIIVLVFVLFSEYGLITRIKLQLKKATLAEEIISEKKEVENLKKLEKRLLKDTMEIEKVAREKYGFSKKDEKTYFIKKDEEK